MTTFRSTPNLPIGSDTCQSKTLYINKTNTPISSQPSCLAYVRRVTMPLRPASATSTSGTVCRHHTRAESRTCCRSLDNRTSIVVAKCPCSEGSATRNSRPPTQARSRVSKAGSRLRGVAISVGARFVVYALPFINIYHSLSTVYYILATTIYLSLYC
ncbi:hypothetical protein BD779DRAFT_1211717 [Infundibulicybe gibba]|nr:hypothetical protein BD779DRAFT_1211717 [Infundibulicybe gibba]